MGKITAYIDTKKQRRPLGKRGKQDSKLSQEDPVLLTLYYLRHYSTFSNMGDVFDLSESYTCKIYHQYTKIMIQVEKVANRKHLLELKPKTVIIDASEQPIERPVKRQQDYYSGKKRHTINVQLIICAASLTILSVALGKGKQQDFSLFKTSRVLVHKESLMLGMTVFRKDV